MRLCQWEASLASTRPLLVLPSMAKNRFYKMEEILWQLVIAYSRKSMRAASVDQIYCATG
jgi:hypothetical protein